MEKRINTLDADTGTPIPQSGSPYTQPSMIKIPPQVATTVCWVALGFGIAWWLFTRNQRVTSRRNEG